MSGECDKCGEHALECTCESLCRRQENDRLRNYSVINASLKPLSEGQDPPADEIPRTWIDVHGREEHEALLKDYDKCKQLGIDQAYEIIVYLKRWGSWLSD